MGLAAPAHRGRLPDWVQRQLWQRCSPHSSCRTCCKASRGTHLAESQRLQVKVVSLALGAGIGDHDGDRALGGVSIAAPLQPGEGSRA